ncbi:MAG: hypothetical protein M3R48_01220 [Candidatus Dormibacteraeota bacterium]|nr:hypothetical protein [Candidatus Dormibacteraeota bacterium]
MLIHGFDPRYIKMCYFATLADLGYRTRVSLANGTEPSSPLADDLHVSFEAFSPQGVRLGSVDSFEVLPPGGFTIVDVDDHVGPGRAIESDGSDVLGIFHMTPGRFVGLDCVDIELSAIFDQVAVSDEYIEYHSSEWSVAAGLAYQSIPMNDKRFGGTRSTLMQSPKLLVDEQNDTHLVLLNVSTSPDYELDISFQLAFMAANGERLANHTVRVPAYGFARVSSREVLKAARGFQRFCELGGNGMVVGFSDNGSVVPLSITRNDRSKGLACDHTLPPMYYLPWWGGEVRKAANQRLREIMFSGASGSPQ